MESLKIDPAPVTDFLLDGADLVDWSFLSKKSKKEAESKVLSNKKPKKEVEEKEEGWQVTHMELFIANSLKYPIALDVDDPDLYVAVKHLPKRMQESACACRRSK